MAVGNNPSEAARLHYVYCDQCGEYQSHTVFPTKKCKCGKLVHDSPNCDKKGQPVLEEHEHGVDCFDC